MVLPPTAVRPSLVCALALLLSILPLGGCGDAAAVATPPVVELPPVSATLNHGFTTVGTLRELTDGRVLVTDERENRLLLVDFDGDSVAEIGREGSGPGEFRGVGPLMPLPADSTLMLDRRLRRWLLLHGGEIVATVEASDPAVAATRSSSLYGADSLGSVVVSTLPEYRGVPRGGPADSLYVMRVDRTTLRVDTLTRASSVEQNMGAGEIEGSGPAAAKPRYMVGIVPSDQVVAFPDGSVAVVRVEPYRVDRCDPSARCRSGPVLREPARPITEAEKAEYLRAAAANAAWPPTTDIEETTGWPERMPPFESFQRRAYPTAALAVSDGRLLVQRVPTPDAPAMRFDVIDEEGRIAMQLRLPVNAQIIGASARHLYVVTTDELDVQHLSRHRWPG